MVRVQELLAAMRLQPQNKLTEFNVYEPAHKGSCGCQSRDDATSSHLHSPESSVPRRHHHTRGQGVGGRLVAVDLLQLGASEQAGPESRTFLGVPRTVCLPMGRRSHSHEGVSGGDREGLQEREGLVLQGRGRRLHC